MHVQESDASTMVEIWTELEPRLRGAASLEEAAQAFAAALHERFSESVVLARVFAAVPFQGLPPDVQQSVRTLAGSEGAGAGLSGETPVLALVGTRGEEPDWCDRRRSRGHAGIPLLSSRFVEAIPMMARLLAELGVPPDWADRPLPGSMAEHLGRAPRLFFVEDASSSTDEAGRKIITAQEFVASHHVESVFGIGGAYPNGRLLAAVVFCRERVARDTAEAFAALFTFFQGRTVSLAEGERIFAAASGAKRRAA